MDGIVVVLDPGHDDTHAGAFQNGAKEQDLTLKIAQYCKAELENYSGIRVYMTRESGACPNGGATVSSQICNKKRVDYAASVGADAYVSFHLNSSTSNTANGVGVYYPNSNYNASVGEIGKGLAGAIYRNLTALGLGMWSDGTMIWNADYDKYPDGSVADRLGVIQNSKKAGIPAVLIEHAFISGTSDYNNFLSSDDKLKSLGTADAQAIVEYYQLNKQGSAPVIAYTQANSSGNLKIKWNEVPGAVAYEVYRDTKNAYDYQKIATVTGAASYTDKNVKQGKKYYYLVRAVYGNGSAGEYSTYATGCVPAQPKLDGIAAAGGRKLTLTWEKAKGAEGYFVYRSTEADSEYEKIAEVSGGKQTYTDTVKSNNKTYYYQVQAYNTNGKKKGVGKFSEVKSAKTLAKPKITAVESEDEKMLTVSWKKTGGADGYIIKRSTKENGTYKKIATVSKEKDTVYQDKTIKKGTVYYYRVQAYRKNDGVKGYSELSDAVSGKTVKQVQIVSITSKNQKALVLEWKKMKGASGYRIRRATEKNGVYKTIKTIKSANTTTFEDKEVKPGKVYYYTVEMRVKTDSGVRYAGKSAASKGQTAAKTTIKAVVSNGSKELDVYWKEVKDAYGYKVKRSMSKNGKYELIATVKGAKKTSYSDRSVTQGKTYYYKIETINKVGKVKGFSGDSTAVSGKTLKKAELSAVTAKNGTVIQLTWKPMSGVSGYQVYRSTTESSGYQKVAEIKGKDSATYKDASLKAGKIYYYKVRAYKKNSVKTGLGSFSAVQKAWTLSAPEEMNVAEENGVLILSWKKVKRASGYTIYRSSTPDGDWKKVAAVSSGNTVTYQDESVKVGDTYYYRIVANNQLLGGKTGRSDYSSVLCVPVLSAGKLSAIALKENNSLEVSWKKVSKAHGYELYASTAQDGKYKKIADTNRINYLHEKLAQRTTYYYKVRPYVVLDNKAVVYGAFSPVQSQTSAYVIMGESGVTVDEMRAYYEARYTFPADTYTEKGASNAQEFFTILKEEADAEGVRAEVLFAQVMLETGGLTFRGDVSAEQCNFGGLGATGNGVAGETFADIRTGLRAQTQHLKAYASSDALNQACVDSRFQYVTRGAAYCVEWLGIPKNPYGKGWAADADYAVKLLRIIDSI